MQLYTRFQHFFMTYYSTYINAKALRQMPRYSSLCEWSVSSSESSKGFPFHILYYITDFDTCLELRRPFLYENDDSLILTMPWDDLIGPKFL